MQCPLCNHSYIHSIAGPDPRNYYCCGSCHLIFVTVSELLPPLEEKKRYDQHNNVLEDTAYTAFLSRAIAQVLPFLNDGIRVLDFGCGPVPALVMVLKESIHCEAYIYDPFYYPAVLERMGSFDVIFSTEVFEHLHQPGKTIDQLMELLNSNGILCIMTELYEDLQQFSDWYYARDLTHVSFFHEKTIEYLCGHYNLEVLPSSDARVIVFRKLK